MQFIDGEPEPLRNPRLRPADDSEPLPPDDEPATVAGTPQDRSSRPNLPVPIPAYPHGVSAPEIAAQPVPGELLSDVYARELQRIGKTDSSEGVLLLLLARMLETPGLAGTAAAGLAQRVMVAADRAFAGAPPSPDAIDDLTRKRRERFG